MNTEVKVEVIKYEKVNLNISQVEELAKSMLSEMYNWKEDYYISKDGKKVIHDVEYYTSHSFEMTEPVRDTTPQDIITYQLFKDMSEFKRNKTKRS
jgi:hypothetical protein